MDLGLTEIQKMLQESSRNFLEENCTMDFIRAMESDDIGITDEIWKNMSEMGWLGLMIPEEYGGSGFDFDDMSISVRYISCPKTLASCSKCVYGCTQMFLTNVKFEKFELAKIFFQ